MSFWSDEEVQRLNEYQKEGKFHPYTCPNDDHEWYDRSLLATNDGWVCPKDGCDYTQLFVITTSPPKNTGLEAWVAGTAAKSTPRNDST